MNFKVKHYYKHLLSVLSLDRSIEPVKTYKKLKEEWKSYIVRILIVFLLYIVFRDFVDSKILFFGKNLIKKNILVDFAIILLIIIYCNYACIRLVKRILISSNLLKWFLVPIVFWYLCFLYLPSPSQIQLVEFHLCPFPYLDVIWFLLVVEVLVIGIQAFRFKTINGSILLSDSSWQIGDIDLFGFKPKAVTIAKELISLNVGTSTGVGINGKWGQGKTSFVTMIKQEMEEEVIWIDFSPWCSKNSSDIIIDFFNTLSDNLQKYSPDLRPTISRYSKALSNLDKTGVLKFTSEISNGSTSIQMRHRAVEQALKYINKKIVIFIDDVDRLISDEILQVLKLVRSTANFPNTIFIVALDRDYVLQTLKDQNLYEPEQYLEKIFQFEFNISVDDDTKAADWLIETIEKNRIAQGISFRIGKGSELEPIPASFYQLVSNLRDAKRVYNQFALAFKLVGNYISADILLALEIIKHKDNSAYYLIKDVTEQYHNKQRFTTTTKQDVLSYLTSENRNQSFTDFLVASIDLDKTSAPVKQLLNFISRADSYKDLAYYNAAFYYFNYSSSNYSPLDEIEIKPENLQQIKEELNRLQAETPQKYNAKLNFISDFVFDKWEAILSPKVNLKQFLNLLTFMYSCRTEVLFSKYVNCLKALQVKGYFSENQEMKDYLLGLLSDFSNNEVNYSGLVLQQILREYCYESIEPNFILSQSDVQDLALSNLQYNISKLTDYKDVENALFYCFYSIDHGSSRVTLIPKALRMFYNYVVENPVGFVKHLIRPTDPYSKSATFMPFTNKVFYSGALEKFLNEIDQDMENLDIVKKYAKSYLHADNENRQFILDAVDHNRFFDGNKIKEIK